MIAVWKHFVLARQECATRVDEVDAGQVILFGNLLRAQVLLDRQRVVGSAFNCRVVGHDHALKAVNTPDAGDDSGARDIVAVHLPRGLPAYFKEVSVLVEQCTDTIARQQFAAFQVFVPRALGPALHDVLVYLTQVIRKRLVRFAIFLEVVRRAIDLGLDDGHGLMATSRH
jgi:hypothetical protein